MHKIVLLGGKVSKFKRIETGIKDLIVIEPTVFGDHRGFFMETYSKKDFEEVGLTMEFVQDNHSFSAQKGTLRGLHFQKNPFAQAKLVRCARGAIMDVAVDIRRGSPIQQKVQGEFIPFQTNNLFNANGIKSFVHHRVLLANFTRGTMTSSMAIPP